MQGLLCVISTLLCNEILSLAGATNELYRSDWRQLTPRDNPNLMVTEPTENVGLAGSTFIDDASCAPTTHPVSILAMHGDAAEIIHYDGGEFLNVDGSIAGAESTVLQYSGCPASVDVEFWTMVGAPHIPVPWVPSALVSIVNWVIEHPRQ